MIVGIDLGTTNSLIAFYDKDQVKIIPNRLGKLLTPSVVSVDDDHQILVGETAREYGYLHPDCTAKAFKRTMGTDKKYMLNGMEFLSEELSSFVLRSLVEDAENYLGEKVSEAIISVPAYFNDNQRKATKKAGELIGLKVSRIINEPTASALAYGVGSDDKNERCMVFDLGGGTFDVSILEYYKSIMEVHAIAGENELGGEDFTIALMDLFVKKAGLDHELLDLYSLNNLYKISEKSKCEFSFSDEVTMSFKYLGNIYQEDISLEEYEEACEPLLDKLRRPVEKSLSDAKITLHDLDRIIMVGGATRLPLVRNFVQRLMFSHLEYVVDPDTAVVVGAALQVAMKQRNKQVEEVILTDVCPFTLGTSVVHDNGVFTEAGYYLPIIERNTVIPVSKKQTVYTAHDNQKTVCVQILQGESRLSKNNLLLGEINMDVPEGPKGKEAVEIVYTYDVNSLLEVEVTVVSTGEKQKIIVQSQYSDMNNKEMQERFEVLQYLKQNPREEEENYLAMLRGNRIYEETLGKDKARVEQALNEFDEVLVSGSRLEIERKRKSLMDLLDEMEDQQEEIFLA